MPKQAKLSLGLDIKPLQEKTELAKQSIAEFGKVKLDPTIRREFKKALVDDLGSQLKIAKSGFDQVNNELIKMSQTGKDAWDNKKAQQLLSTADKYSDQIKEINRQQKLMSGGGLGGGLGGAGGAAGGGILKRMGGSGMRALGMLGLGFGVQQSIQRSIQQAGPGMGLRELTGGAMIGDDISLGFTRQQRRERATGIARSAGRDMTGQELEARTRESEVFQRAYGVSGEQYGEAFGAARRGGVADEGKFVADAIGSAVAAGMSGSAVGEYLASMTGYMEEMSKGIDIDQKSLTGMGMAFGKVLGDSRPDRIFDALKSIENTFKSTDPYQQFLAYRSLDLASGGSLSPAGIEVRRNMGLFGTMKQKDIDALDNAGLNKVADIFKVSGSEMVNSMLTTVMRDVVNLGGGQQDKYLAFKQGTGMSDAAAVPIFTKLWTQYTKTGKIKGIKLSKEEIQELKDAQQTPEQRAAKNMKSFEGAVLEFGSRIDSMKNKVADGMTSAVVKMTGAVDEFAKATGMFSSDVEKLFLVLGVGGLAKIAITRVGAGIAGSAIGSAAGGLLTGSMVAAALTSTAALAGAAVLGVAVGEAIRLAINWGTDNWLNDTTSRFFNKLGYGGNIDTGNLDLLKAQKDFGPEGSEETTRMMKQVKESGGNMTAGGYASMLGGLNEERRNAGGRWSPEEQVTASTRIVSEQLGEKAKYDDLGNTLGKVMSSMSGDNVREITSANKPSEEPSSLDREQLKKNDESTKKLIDVMGQLNQTMKIKTSKEKSSSSFRPSLGKGYGR